MAKQQASAASKKNLIILTKEFIQEVKVEMSKVTWPSREELKSSTQIVLLFLVIFASIIFVYDHIFQFVVVQLLKLG